MCLLGAIVAVSCSPDEDVVVTVADNAGLNPLSAVYGAPSRK